MFIRSCIGTHIPWRSKDNYVRIESYRKGTHGHRIQYLHNNKMQNQSIDYQFTFITLGFQMSAFYISWKQSTQYCFALCTHLLWHLFCFLSYIYVTSVMKVWITKKSMYVSGLWIRREKPHKCQLWSNCQIVVSEQYCRTRWIRCQCIKKIENNTRKI